jgi:hypothetical protein
MAKIPSTRKKSESPYVYKSDAEFAAAVAKEVAKQLAIANKVTKQCTQDQHDLLTIVAPNRVKRHEYEIIEN